MASHEEGFDLWVDFVELSSTTTTNASSSSSIELSPPPPVYKNPIQDEFSRLFFYHSSEERNHAFFAIINMLTTFFVELKPRPEILTNFVHLWHLQDMDWMQLNLICLMLTSEALSRKLASLTDDEDRLTRFIRWLTPHLNEYGSQLDSINGRVFIHNVRCKWIELH